METTTPNLFIDGRPMSRLYDEGVLTNVYLAVMVLIDSLSKKVVHNSTYSHTSTWSPLKPTRHPSKGQSYSEGMLRLRYVVHNITSVELP